MSLSNMNQTVNILIQSSHFIYINFNSKQKRERQKWSSSFNRLPHRFIFHSAWFCEIYSCIVYVYGNMRRNVMHSYFLFVHFRNCFLFLTMCPLLPFLSFYNAPSSVTHSTNTGIPHLMKSIFLLRMSQLNRIQTWILVVFISFYIIHNFTLFSSSPVKWQKHLSSNKYLSECFFPSSSSPLHWFIDSSRDIDVILFPFKYYCKLLANEHSKLNV